MRTKSQLNRDLCMKANDNGADLVLLVYHLNTDEYSLYRELDSEDGKSRRFVSVGLGPALGDDIRRFLAEK